MIDGESKVYGFNYDGHDRLKEVIDPLGNKVSYEYDAVSNVTAFAGIGIDGKTFNQGFDYDPLDRLTQQRVLKDNGEILSKYIYNIPDRKVSMISPNQNQWDMTLTGTGLTKHLADPLGNRDDYSYDSRGWLTSKIENEAVGKTLTRTLSHTALGAPSVINDSIGREYNQIYSRDKQLPEYSLDPEKGLTSFAYDGLNRLSSEKRHIAYQGVIKEAGTTYTYDANGNLSTITDSENNVTRYEYDTKDRLTDIYYPGTTNEHITYNNRDQVLTYQDLNGTVITNTYDDAGRLTDRTAAGGPGVEGPFNEHFEYDGLNRLTLASNSQANVRFIYDQAGRLQSEIQELKNGDGGESGGSIVVTYTVNYQHDDNGNNTQITYPSGKVISITPDALDRISTIKDGSNNLIAGYTYEGKGKIRQKNIHDVITMDTAFDEGRRPLSMTYKNNQIQQVYIDKAMGWNKTDLKEFDLEYGKKDAYAYDSTYRLRKVDNKNDNAQYEYKLDELENAKTVIETINGVSVSKNAVINERQQLVNYNGKTLTYDNNGNMTGFDKAGYVYNWKNQLVKVSTGTGVNLEYQYDALGRRTAKIIKTPESQTVIRYIYDGYRVIEERDEQDRLKYRYTYGNGIDERLEMEKRVVKPDGTVAYKSYYLLHDSIGNVIGLTNAAGLLIEKYKYNPYGKVKFYNTENSPKVDSITIRDGKIKLYFDRAVDINNIDIQVVIIGNQQQIPVDIESGQSGRQYLLAPESGPLPQNEPLNIKVNSKEDSTSSGFADQTTLLLSQDFVYHGGAVEVIHDQGAPRVENVTHEGNDLLIAFNEDVKPSSLSDHIELSYQGTTINGSIAIIGDNQAKFTPDEPLSDTKQYSVKVSNIEDYAGKVIALFSLDFEVNVESKMLFSYSILTESIHSIVGNNSLMHGRDYEPEVGLYYYRARYYHPELGRFLQPDPMGYEDSMNLYQGFNMNPANFVDPFGLDYFSRERDALPVFKPNPADTMVNASLKQHGKNTARNAALVGIAQIPVVGKPFVAGYVTRQVGEGYIDCVKRRWNDVSVLESGTKTFFKKAASPFTGLFDLVFEGPKGMYKAVTDESLSDEEAGMLVMNSYDQTAWTGIGGYYGYKFIKNKIQYRGLGDSTTSPWLNDSRIGVRMHLEEFREGGSILVPESIFKKLIRGAKKIGRTDGQFITTKEAMDKLIKEVNGSRETLKTKLGIPQEYWNEPLIRINIHNPLLHNARFPSGFEAGANKLFRWGGYTKGGLPEIVIDQIPEGSFSYKYLEIN